MGESTFSGVLIFFPGQLLSHVLIIGLLAAVLSLINKPKQLRIDVLAEASFAQRKTFAYFCTYYREINGDVVVE